jgi:hypothetical protein
MDKVNKGIRMQSSYSKEETDSLEEDHMSATFTMWLLYLNLSQQSPTFELLLALLFEKMH